MMIWMDFTYMRLWNAPLKQQQKNILLNMVGFKANVAYGAVLKTLKG